MICLICFFFVIYRCFLFLIGICLNKKVNEEMKRANESQQHKFMNNSPGEARNISSPFCLLWQENPGISGFLEESILDEF